MDKPILLVSKTGDDTEDYFNRLFGSRAVYGDFAAKAGLKESSLFRLCRLVFLKKNSAGLKEISLFGLCRLVFFKKNSAGLEEISLLHTSGSQ